MMAFLSKYLPWMITLWGLSKKKEAEDALIALKGGQPPKAIDQQYKPTGDLSALAKKQGLPGVMASKPAENTPANAAPIPKQESPAYNATKGLAAPGDLPGVLAPSGVAGGAEAAPTMNQAPIAQRLAEREAPGIVQILPSVMRLDPRALP